MEKNKIICHGLLRCLLWFITDFTGFYYVNYGAPTREFAALKRLCKIGLENPSFVEIGKIGILQNRREGKGIFITEYYCT